MEDQAGLLYVVGQSNEMKSNPSLFSDFKERLLQIERTHRNSVAIRDAQKWMSVASLLREFGVSTFMRELGTNHMLDDLDITSNTVSSSNGASNKKQQSTPSSSKKNPVNSPNKRRSIPNINMDVDGDVNVNDGNDTAINEDIENGDITSSAHTNGGDDPAATTSPVLPKKTSSQKSKKTITQADIDAAVIVEENPYYLFAIPKGVSAFVNYIATVTNFIKQKDEIVEKIKSYTGTKMFSDDDIESFLAKFYELYDTVVSKYKEYEENHNGNIIRTILSMMKVYRTSFESKRLMKSSKRGRPPKIVDPSSPAAVSSKQKNSADSNDVDESGLSSQASPKPKTSKKTSSSTIAKQNVTSNTSHSLKQKKNGDELESDHQPDVHSKIDLSRTIDEDDDYGNVEDDGNLATASVGIVTQDGNLSSVTPKTPLVASSSTPQPTKSVIVKVTGAIHPGMGMTDVNLQDKVDDAITNDKDIVSKKRKADNDAEKFAETEANVPVKKIATRDLDAADVVVVVVPVENVVANVVSDDKKSTEDVKPSTVVPSSVKSSKASVAASKKKIGTKMIVDDDDEEDDEDDDEEEEEDEDEEEDEEEEEDDEEEEEDEDEDDEDEEDDEEEEEDSEEDEE